MYFVCSLTVMFILGFFTELQLTWRGLFDQSDSNPHFYALMDPPLSEKSIKDRLLGIKSIVNVKVLDAAQSKTLVQDQLSALGVPVPSDLLQTNLGTYEISLHAGLDLEQRKEARKYFLHEFLSDGVMATEVESPFTNKELGLVKTALRDYFLIGILGGLILLSIFSLWEFAKESSFRANVIESFHRQKNIGLKTYLISWMPFALVGGVVSLIYGTGDLSTGLFLLFWLLLNLSITIMCQHTYYVKRLY